MLSEQYPTAVRLIAFWTATGRPAGAGVLLHILLHAPSVIIYHLLRHDVDGAEMDEVFVEEQEQQFGLPPVTTDEAGVPAVADHGNGVETPADSVSQPAD